MQTGLHPATRRIAWLVTVIGAGAVLFAALYAILNAGSGNTIAKSAADVGWLLAVGLFWLVTGLLLLSWLRSTDAANTAESTDLASAANVESRLSNLEQTVQAIQTRLDSLSKTKQGAQAVSENIPEDRLQRLDHELDNLGTTVQDAHRRLDELGEVNTRLDEVESQLDALYVTLHDIHRRIDTLEASH